MPTDPAQPPNPAARQVRCPGCGRPAEYSPANRWRPFCSERCRMVDLGAWADERYRVAGPPSTNEPNAEGPGEPGDRER